MKLYHGTNVDFDEIDLSKSKPNKDFGKGFYLSDNYEQALNMAHTKMNLLETGKPIVQTYEINNNEWEKLHILRFKDYSEEWAKFILLNRNNSTELPIHPYDVVIGPIANDRVGIQLWKFENHSIDLPTLVRNLQYMKGITLYNIFSEQNML